MKLAPFLLAAALNAQDANPLSADVRRGLIEVGPGCGLTGMGSELR